MTSKNSWRDAQVLARRQLDVAQPGALLDLAEVRTAAHADDADLAGVALQQGVDRLGGRVGDQLDLLGADLGGQLGDGVDDPGGDAARRRCASWARPRWPRSARGGQLDGDRLGERAADVDADAHASSRPRGVSRGAAGARAGASARGGRRTRTARRTRTRRRATPGPRASARSARCPWPRPGRSAGAARDVRRYVMTSAACSVCTALPRKATEVTITSTTAVFMNVRTGSLRPSLNTTRRRRRGRRRARPMPSRMYAAEALAERQQRLVEQRRLEALAVHGGEPDGHQRGRSSRPTPRSTAGRARTPSTACARAGRSARTRRRTARPRRRSAVIASSTSRPTGSSAKSVGISSTVTTVATAARPTPTRIGRMNCGLRAASR